MLFVQPVTTAENIKDGYTNNTKEVYILDGTTTTPIALPAAKTGYNFSGWSGNIVDGNITVNGDMTFTAQYSLKNITVHVVAKSGMAVSINGSTVAGSTSSRSDETKDVSYEYGTTLIITVNTHKDVENPSITINGGSEINLTSGTETNVGTYRIGDDGKDGRFDIVTDFGGGCVAAGTLVNMSDDTTKKVEDIVTGDEVLVFNHLTGTYDISKVIVNVHYELEWTNYEVINLEFSNNSKLKIINEHSLFDLDLNKYVVITKDSVNEYLGHKFYSASFVNGIYVEEIITLENFYISEEFTGMYNPITEVHLNVFTDGLLSLPGEVKGFMNMFVFDSTLKYDEELIMNDIQIYGLYSYEELSPFISKDLYNILPSPYLKVAVGKGMTPFEDLLRLRDNYFNKYGIY